MLMHLQAELQYVDMCKPSRQNTIRRRQWGWQEVLLTLLRVPLTPRQTTVRCQGAAHPEWFLWLPQGAEPSYEVIEKAHDDKAEMVQRAKRELLHIGL